MEDNSKEERRDHYERDGRFGVKGGTLRRDLLRSSKSDEAFVTRVDGNTCSIFGTQYSWQHGAGLSMDKNKRWEQLEALKDRDDIVVVDVKHISPYQHAFVNGEKVPRKGLNKKLPVNNQKNNNIDDDDDKDNNNNNNSGKTESRRARKLREQRAESEQLRKEKDLFKEGETIVLVERRDIRDKGTHTETFFRGDDSYKRKLKNKEKKQQRMDVVIEKML